MTEVTAPTEVAGTPPAPRPVSIEGTGEQAGEMPGEKTPRRRSPARGLVVLLLGLILAAALAGHRHVPENHGFALVWESAMPWAWVFLVALALVGLVRHSWLSLIGVLIPAVVWGAMFAPQLMGGSGGTGDPDFTVASQNISAANVTSTQAANALVRTDADVVGVEELTGLGGQRVAAVLSGHYPYHTQVSTVGLWSKYPMDGVEQLGLGMSWNRALRATVRTSHGGVAVYVVHLPSVRLGQEAARDRALRRLTALVAADGHRRVVVAGDFNTASTDRHFSPLSSRLTDSRAAVGGGFGFTWPARFPLVRPDHVLSKGFTTLSDRVLPGNGSDHRAVVVRLALS